MDDLIEKMIAAHALTDGNLTHKMQAAYNALTASGEWAVVPVEPTEEMCAKGVLQAERVLRIKDVQLVEMEYVYKAMTQARPKVAG